MMSRFASRLLAAATAFALVGTAGAQTALLDEVHTISNGAAAVEKSFSITQAGSYELTLTDLKLPAALTSAKLAVTSGSTVLGTASTTATSASAVLDFNAPAGTVVVHIVGKPDASASLGSVGVKITRPPDATSVQEFVATIATPEPAIPENQARLDEDVTLPTTGTYEVTLTDLGLPQPLTDLELGVTEAGGAQVAVLATAGSTTFTAQAGTKYNVLVLAEADASVTAGLFNVRIREVSSGTVALNRTVTLGRIEQLGTVTLSAAPYVLTFTDFQFATALAQEGVALVRDGQLAALTTASGSTPFTAQAGDHVVYSFASAAPSNTGSFAVTVAPPAGAAVFTEARTVGGTAGTTPAYTFVADIPTAGSYHVRLADFGFPSRFTDARLAVAQGSDTLGTLTAPGGVNVTAAAGQLFVVVLANPASASGGVLGIDVAPAAGGAAVFATTQGVGNLFQSRKVSVPTAGSYRVKVQDIGFPATLREFGVVITRGADAFGTLLTGSQVPGSTPAISKVDFDATPGDYFLSFIATPDATEGAGTYGIQVAAKPAAPTVTLTADATQVTVGGTTKLTWTSANATSCAADGWTSARDTSGSAQITVSSTTTYKMDCTGDGGVTSQSVTVTAAAQSTGGGGGGGGTMDPMLLVGLGLCVLYAWRKRLADGE